MDSILHQIPIIQTIAMALVSLMCLFCLLGYAGIIRWIKKGIPKYQMAIKWIIILIFIPIVLAALIVSSAYWVSWLIKFFTEGDIGSFPYSMLYGEDILVAKLPDPLLIMMLFTSAITWLLIWVCERF